MSLVSRALGSFLSSPERLLMEQEAGQAVYSLPCPLSDKIRNNELIALSDAL